MIVSKQQNKKLKFMLPITVLTNIYQNLLLKNEFLINKTLN